MRPTINFVQLSARAAKAATGLMVVALAVATGATAQSYSVLYSFQCEPDGADPGAALIQDAEGTLYGTTQAGGAYGYGTVFELSATGQEGVLHSFAGPPGDGWEPLASLIRDAAGNFYGTTAQGGKHNEGTVFKLAAWGQETLLHSFSGKGGDGAFAAAGLVRDSAGNLYGTTTQGAYGYGTAFEMTSKGAETVLFDFTPSTGEYPEASLVRDSAGNLYGTTDQGGNHLKGTVFRLSVPGTYTILHNFGGSSQDGEYPSAGLVRDPVGNLFGTTGYGGTAGEGTVFEVNAAGKERVLYGFAGSADGALPIAGLVRDSSNNLFGVTVYGGSDACYDGFKYGCGVVFEATPQGKESVLYSFGGTPDGANPVGALLRDSSGNLYGTTSLGGTYGCGTVFKYTP